MKISTSALLVVLPLLMSSVPANAQISPDLSLPNNTNIQINENLRTIEGGTQIGNNLFHSFKDFSVPTGASVHFNNGLNIENIITRITGGSISNIDGLISANGTANLFLINPSGIVFGPNARLDINGSFFATTADSVEFANGSGYSATDPQAPLLSIDIPIGISFTNRSGAISVQGNGKGLTALSVRSTPIIRNNSEIGLQVHSNNALVLIGNKINFVDANVTAEQGQIEIGSVGSGKVNFNASNQGWNFDYKTSDFQNIDLTGRSLLYTSGDGAGAINIQGKFVSIKDGSGILSQTYNSSSDGINLKADSLNIEGISSEDGNFYSLLRTESLGSANGGNINIYTKDLVIEGGGNLGTRNYSVGKGGTLNIDASESINLIGYSAFSPFFTSSIITSNLGSGEAGSINIKTGDLLAKDGGLITSLTRGLGNGGEVNINANSIKLTNSKELISLGEEYVNYVPSSLASQTFNAGNAGKLTLSTSNLLVGEKATINTSSTGAGSAGSVAIKAFNIEVQGNISSAVIVANQTTQQRAGGLEVPIGLSGEVTINANNININSGYISVRNLGASQAGTLKINSDSISLNRKGSIRASTTSSEGGNIFLDVRKLQLNDSYITATAGGNGNGGNISIDADTVVLLETSNITANAFEGQGGNIKINSPGFFVSANSKVSATSEQGVNGTVKINTSQLDVVNSDIVSSSFNPTVIENTCSPEPPSYYSLTIPGKGGFPQSPNDLLTSTLGWAELSVPIAPKQLEQSVQPDETQDIVVAQGWKDNGNGTVNFTITPDPPKDITAYSSPLKSSCLHPKPVE